MKSIPNTAAKRASDRASTAGAERSRIDAPDRVRGHCERRVLHGVEQARAHPAHAHLAILARRDEHALAEAAAWDQLLANGAAVAPLAGRTLSVKACFDVAGWVTHAGSRALAGEPAACADASLVAALRRSGAVLVAQTNMTEFAYGALGVNAHYGTPTTPLGSHDSHGALVAGGSSSGGAVSVALGFADLALGSDTSGSARIPAAFCGVAGFKPSRGRYPDGGMLYLAPSFDVPGLLATSAADCRDVDGALTGHGHAIRALPALRGLCCLVPERLLTDTLALPVASQFDAWLATLSAAGVRIVRRPLDCIERAGAVARDGGVIAAEAYALHRTTLERLGAHYDPLVRARISAGADVKAHDYVAALRELHRLAAQYHDALADTGADAVLTPTVPIPPPALDALRNEDAYLRTNAQAFRLTEFANRLDLPSISIPGDLRQRGPIGLLITGRHGRDRYLLDIAAAVEAQFATT